MDTSATMQVKSKKNESHVSNGYTGTGSCVESEIQFRLAPAPYESVMFSVKLSAPIEEVESDTFDERLRGVSEKLFDSLYEMVQESANRAESLYSQYASEE